ncbi:hypothetical protein [Pseudooctadecabacter sp.]|uniref:hypothetical protein n=1 Tax=Pseudooctadecabacter sp. TaxID=1966338 RepID=UPI0035C83E70
MIRARIAAVVMGLCAGQVTAQELGLLYEEPLGGVYKQWWSGAVIGADPNAGVLVFVRGDGKSGDFYGVLSVDCESPEFSRWVAQGGVVSPETVPLPAIDVIRAEACGSP